MLTAVVCDEQIMYFRFVTDARDRCTLIGKIS